MGQRAGDSQRRCDRQAQRAERAARQAGLMREEAVQCSTRFLVAWHPILSTHSCDTVSSEWPNSRWRNRSGRRFERLHRDQAVRAKVQGPHSETTIGFSLTPRPAYISGSTGRWPHTAVGQSRPFSSSAMSLRTAFGFFARRLLSELVIGLDCELAGLRVGPQGLLAASRRGADQAFDPEGR